MLGENECDWETAFFMTYGRNPTQKEISQHNEYLLKEHLKKIGLTKNEWLKQMKETDNDYHIHNDAPDAYICMRGWKFPEWL